MRAGLQSPVLCELRGFSGIFLFSLEEPSTSMRMCFCLSLNGVSTEIIYSVPVFISLNLMAGVKSKAAHVDGLKSYLSLTSSGLPGPNFGQVFPLLAKCGVTGRDFFLCRLVRDSCA